MIVGSPKNEALFRRLVQADADEVESQALIEQGFIGNRNSQIFHTFACSSLPAEQNRMYFATRDEAIDAGHRACSRCNP